MTKPYITIKQTNGNYVVRIAGAILGESKDAVALSEGDYPEVIYFPRTDIAMDFLDASALKTTCPHKGGASYFSFVGKSSVIENAVWSYENPHSDVAGIKDMLAFDTSKATVEMV